MFRFFNNFKFLIIPLIAVIFIILIPVNSVCADEALQEKINELGVHKNETPSGWEFENAYLHIEGTDDIPYYTPAMNSEQYKMINWFGIIGRGCQYLYSPSKNKITICIFLFAKQQTALEHFDSLYNSCVSYSAAAKSESARSGEFIGPADYGDKGFEYTNYSDFKGFKRDSSGNIEYDESGNAKKEILKINRYFIEFIKDTAIYQVHGNNKEDVKTIVEILSRRGKNPLSAVSKIFEKKPATGAQKKETAMPAVLKIVLMLAGGAAVIILVMGPLPLLQKLFNALAGKSAPPPPAKAPKITFQKLTRNEIPSHPEPCEGPKKPEKTKLTSTPKITFKKPATQPEKITPVGAGRDLPSQEKSEKKEEEKKKKQLEEIALTASPYEVTADGKSTSVIKIFAADNDRHPAAGEGIVLWFENYDGSKIEPGAVVTNIDGEATAKFTAGKLSGEQILSARAKSNPAVRATVKLKLKEEVCYTARDNWTGIKVRVNIPSKALNTINPAQVLGARVTDNFDNEIKTGFAVNLFSLPALIGAYGIRNDAPYKKEAERWKNLYSKCSRIANELKTALEVGLGVGLMIFTNSVALMLADEFGGELISFSSKVFGKFMDKIESYIGLEKQEEVYSLIHKEKDYIEEMAGCAQELFNCWDWVNHEGGDYKLADKIMWAEYETKFYELNNKILAVAIHKGRITESFTQADFDAVNTDIESINRVILEVKNNSRKIQTLADKIRQAAGF